MKNKSLVRFIRLGILALSIVFFLFLSAFISEHAICPIGGFEMFFTKLFSTGFSLAGLFSGMVIIFLIMSVLSLVLRRVYCGYICPMGAMQEFMQIIGSHILPKKIRNLRVPKKIDRILSWVKYGVLASFVIGAATVGGHWMLKGDPFIAMINSGSRRGFINMAQKLPFATLFFVAILISALFAGRLFCRYICPAGAWYAILSKLCPSKIVRNKSSCINCGLCSKVCPMGIDVAHLDSVKSAECINCRSCEVSCPKDSLSFKLVNKDVPAAIVPFAAAAVFAGSVGLANKLLPARGTGNGAASGGGNGLGNGNGYGKGPGEASGEHADEHSDGKNTSLSEPVSSQNITGASSEEKARLAGIGGCGDCNACGFCTGILAEIAKRV